MNNFEIYLLDLKDDLDDPKVIEKILDVIFENPFIKINLADFDRNYTYSESLEKKSLIGQVKRKKVSSIRFLEEVSKTDYVNIMKTKNRNVIHFHLNKSFLEKVSLMEISNYILRLAKTLPNFHSSQIQLIPGNEIGEFYYSNDIIKVPSRSFGGMYIEFMHYISPRAYLDEYEKKDLLNAPAVAITEHTGAIIQIQAYSDLADPISKTNIDLLKMLNPYLREKAKWNT